MSLRIRLSPERRAELLERLRDFSAETLDRELGELGAELLLDFVVRELGPQVYNQAIRDAHGFMTDKLADLEGEFYEPEERAGG